MRLISWSLLGWVTCGLLGRHAVTSVHDETPGRSSLSPPPPPPPPPPEEVAGGGEAGGPERPSWDHVMSLDLLPEVQLSMVQCLSCNRQDIREFFQLPIANTHTSSARAPANTLVTCLLLRSWRSLAITGFRITSRWPLLRSSCALAQLVRRSKPRFCTLAEA